MAPGGVGNPAPASDDLGSGSGPAPWVFALLLGLVGGGVLFLVVFSRRRRSPSTAGDLATVPALDVPPPRASSARAAPSEEANVPRWLRASVRGQRAWTPSREPVLHTSRRQTLTFDQPVAESATRLVVRYDHVEILDERNEAYAQTLGEVGTGDEVEILELAEAWALVRTPRGVTGWLPTMTIGAPQAAPEAPELPASAPDPGAWVPRGEVSRAPTGRSTSRRRSKGNAPAG